MAETICPENILEEIPVDILLDKSLEKKKQGLRLSQACAAYVNDKYELSYSFANDETYELTTLRVVIDKDTVVPSITEIVPSAVFYENEMKELFGINIVMLSMDYEDRLYRIEQEAPMGPKKEEA
ncbi:MAG: NADH-quinone oxidoreductase subunit C [Lachnospiraceae bacterium]|nr:NADH-quinone oxidoreductase subunit C [Lachnospiraceae bacterium]